MTIDLVTVTHDSWAPLVGQGFTVGMPDGPVTLLLDNVKLWPEATVRDNHVEIDGVVLPPRRAFSLTFEGPREPLLAPGMRRLEHPECGAFDLYLSAFRQDQTCTLYESVFS